MLTMRNGDAYVIAAIQKLPNYICIRIPADMGWTGLGGLEIRYKISDANVAEYLFLGDGGEGKSTHTDLWQQVLWIHRERIDPA